MAKPKQKKAQKKEAEQASVESSNPLTVRLQKVLAQAGIASRRKAEELILEGRVTINGKIAEIGSKVDPRRDKIAVDGTAIGQHEKLVYIRLYKPTGYLTALSDNQGRPMVADLIKDIPERIYPVGRLDYNTEGVLLLTNDGVLAHALAHPSHQIPRTYHVKVRGNPSPTQFQKLLTGVALDDGVARALHAERIRTTQAGHLWFELVMTEGRNREIRRMCEAIGHTVTRLLRVNFANIDVNDLIPGEYSHLTPEQVVSLYDLAQVPHYPSLP